MNELITIFLPTEWRGIPNVEQPFTLNLVENGKMLDVYFWRPSVEENGKHFLRVPLKSKKAFIKACEV